MATQADAPEKEIDSTKPQTMAIPEEGYFKLRNGRYGRLYASNASLLWLYDHCEGQAWTRGRYPWIMARQSRRQ